MIASIDRVIFEMLSLPLIVPRDVSKHRINNSTLTNLANNLRSSSPTNSGSAHHTPTARPPTTVPTPILIATSKTTHPTPAAKTTHIPAQRTTSQTAMAPAQHFSRLTSKNAPCAPENRTSHPSVTPGSSRPDVRRRCWG